MRANGFALLMGALLFASGVWGPRLVARLDLVRESRLIQDPRLRLATRRRVMAMRAALIVMGLGLALSGFRLTGTAATISLVLSAVLMAIGLVGITVAMILSIRQTR